ncbi:terminase small subunit [Rhodococcus phage Whack]|uniref:Terminase small subunit n=1 Tax=Rhodococcus phage Whack TaxID=2591132 RepID=A0A515MKB7_9CAUD|nr:terminase small subunit [Rhodococcus phage Whack]QDM57064.1 terminase small subunit [Rhodococcus phage Whack]
MNDEANSLGTGGRQLFDEMSLEEDSYELTSLIVETCRVKDRLDLCHRVLSGEKALWMRLVPSRGDSTVLEVRIDSAAQESRQLLTVYRQMLAEIKRRRADDVEPGADGYGNPLDDL